MVEGSTATLRELPIGVNIRVLRRQFDGPYIASNGYTLEMALAARAEGNANVVAFGRPCIANPDLVACPRQGLSLAKAGHAAYYGGGAPGYTDWPTTAASA